jgi:tRNA-dihydrouridine synthase
MGCPAPKVYKKNVGGGLLRSVEEAKRVISTLRNSVEGLFTVKMRIGFESDEEFFQFLDIINDQKVDMLSIHGRTVKQGYRGGVDYDRIAEAVSYVKCPVFANGNITSYKKANWVAKKTKAHGVMIGRNAIRNPWIFRQFQEFNLGKVPYQPNFLDARDYVERLHTSMLNKNVPEKNHLGMLKKFLNFIGLSIDPDGIFLKKMRRAQSLTELFGICDQYMVHTKHANNPIHDEPFDGLLARPNRESNCS